MTKPRTVTASFYLTAEAVDVAKRTIAGMLIPYGVEGQTSIGPLTVQAGSLTSYDDRSRLKLFLGHDREKPVGYCTSYDDSADGLRCSWQLGTSERATEALTEAADKVRDAFSVELDQLILSDDETEVVAGFVRGAAQVTVPAFDDARIAASHQEGTTMEPCATCGLSHASDITCAANAIQVLTREQGAAAGAAPAELAGAAGSGATGTPAAAAPAGGAPAPSRNRRPSDAIASLDGFYAAMHAKNARMDSYTPEMQAALDDITYTNNSGAMPPQWVGQLWQGVNYQRKVVPLLGTPRPLTSRKVDGWRWVVKPEVDTYAGNKAEVPSNAADSEAVSVAAAILAGAHDIDRSFVDFNDQAFIQAYYEAMTESYAIKSDAAVTDWFEANATVNATPAYEGFLGAIAAGVQAIGDTTGAQQTFVIANSADLIPWALATTEFDLPAFLSLLGISPERIVTHNSVTAGKVVVGTSAAASFYELPSSPVRVQAIDVANMGVDAGVFGYHAELLHDADGLQLVTIDTGV